MLSAFGESSNIGDLKMAVDKYANEDIQNGKIADSVNVTGNKVVTMIQKVSIAADDGANSVYRLFQVASNMIPVKVDIVHEALAASSSASSSYNLGIYEQGGEALDADALAAALDLKTAATIAAPKNGLGALTVDTIGKKIYELAGHDVGNKDTGYDIALTAVTPSATAGDLVVIATFVQG